MGPLSGNLWYGFNVMYSFPSSSWGKVFGLNKRKCSIVQNAFFLERLFFEYLLALPARLFMCFEDLLLVTLPVLVLRAPFLPTDGFFARLFFLYFFFPPSALLAN